MKVGLQELYILLMVSNSTCSGDSELLLQGNDLETVIVDMFYPLVCWNISNDVPGDPVIHVQWLSMSGMLDRLSKQVEKELILPCPL